MLESRLNTVNMHHRTLVAAAVRIEEANEYRRKQLFGTIGSGMSLFKLGKNAFKDSPIKLL
jgi:hypothetical protein